MPRPTRSSRTRRGAQAAAPPATSSHLAPPPATVDKVTTIPSHDSEEDDLYGVSDRDEARQPAASAPATRAPAAAGVSLLGGGRDTWSGLEINDSEIFGNLDGSSPAAGARSADASALSVGRFRRRRGARRRPSSVAGTDDAPIRPSSRGPETPGVGSALNLGHFRRRRRQPSILMSSAQKAGLGLLQRSRAASVEADDQVAVESDAEDESFLPEAEGTPVWLSRGRKSVGREDDEAALHTEAGRETRSKKRKSTESHESAAAKRQAVGAEVEEAVHKSIEIEAQSSPLSIHDSENPSSPPSFVMRSLARRRASPEDLGSDIMAPPEDSDSSEGSPSVWPSLTDLGKKHKGRRARKAAPGMDDDMSDASDPPSLTHSPNFQATKPATKTKPKESPKLSTADLEALLPRRRRKSRQDPYDPENVDDASEQEASRRRTAKRKPGRPLNGFSKTNQTKAANATDESAKRTTKRTYGSRRFDRENTEEGDSIDASAPLDDTAFEADVNDGTTTSMGGLPAELKAAFRKFKEVDKWELDFEEVEEPSSDLPEGR